MGSVSILTLLGVVCTCVLNYDMWTVALIFNSGVGFILLSTPIMESVQAEVAYIGFLPNPFVHGVFLV